MPTLKGTRTYWKPSSSTAAATPKQVLKNVGYISVVLQAVQYKSSGSFWQKTFGGSDKITVSTQVTWQSSGPAKVAAAIQDFRKVKVPSVNALAIGRNIVLKVPAVADGVEMQIGISAVHDDNLGKTLTLLNSDEFKQPLQLAPVAVGQILTIASLVKKVFTDVDPSQVLSASYPGIISEGATQDPVANNRLVEGYIILVVKQDDNDQLDFDPNQLSVSGNGLLYGGQPIPNTYVVYNVTYDPWRGRDSGSAWSKKFDQASSKADELIFATDDQRKSIITASFDLLKEGGALLDDDDNYVRTEKTNLKKAAIQEVQDKIAANTGGEPAPEHLAAALESVQMAAPVAELEFVDQNVRDDVNAYASDLAKAGLHFGFSFRPPVPQPRAAEESFAAPLAPPAGVCPVQNFSGVTPDKWNCLVQKAAQHGLSINGNQGQASQDGFTISWNYNPPAQTLAIACLAKPWWAPCGTVNSQIQDLALGCL